MFQIIKGLDGKDVVTTDYFEEGEKPENVDENPSKESWSK